VLRTACVGSLVTVAAVAAACGSGSDEAALDLSKPPGCYASVSRDADVSAVPPTNDPRAACMAEWKNGAFASSRNTPRLTICVGPEGTPIVIPAESDDECADIGLATPRR